MRFGTGLPVSAGNSPFTPFTPFTPFIPFMPFMPFLLTLHTPAPLAQSRPRPGPGCAPRRLPPYLPPFCLLPHVVWEPVPEGGQPFIQTRTALLPAELEDLQEGLQARGSVTEALRKGAPSLIQCRPHPGSPHRPRAGPAGESRVLHAHVTS